MIIDPTIREGFPDQVGFEKYRKIKSMREIKTAELIVRTTIKNETGSLSLNVTAGGLPMNV